MQGEVHVERELFRAIEASGARVVLIGRRAMAPNRDPDAKRWSGRDKDLADLRLLQALAEQDR